MNRAPTKNKMPRQTYILGAGFSKPADFPLVNQFGSCLEQNRSNIVCRFGQQRFSDFRRLISISSSIEDAFEAVRASGIIEDSEKLEDAVAWTIVSCCEKFLSNVPNIESYFRFLELVRSQGAALITLNYDTILEMVLYVDGLQDRPRLSKTKFDFIRFDYQVKGWSKYCSFHEVSEGGISAFTYHDVPFIKLHGAVNFHACPDHRWSAITDLTNNTYSDRCQKSGALGRPCNKRIRPAIIPPKKVKDVSLFQELWEKGKELLLQSEIITLIGLNLNNNDQDFLRLLRDSLATPDKSLGIVNWGEDRTARDWQQEVLNKLAYNIPVENVYLGGMINWIEQMTL